MRVRVERDKIIYFSCLLERKLALFIFIPLFLFILFISGKQQQWAVMGGEGVVMWRETWWRCGDVPGAAGRVIRTIFAFVLLFSFFRSPWLVVACIFFLFPFLHLPRGSTGDVESWKEEVCGSGGATRCLFHLFLFYLLSFRGYAGDRL
jgi:hypothetical protein